MTNDVIILLLPTFSLVSFLLISYFIFVFYPPPLYFRVTGIRPPYHLRPFLPSPHPTTPFVLKNLYRGDDSS